MSVEYDKLFLLDKINNRAECRNCDTVYSFERGSTGYSTLKNAAEYKSNKIDVFMKKILGNFPTSEAAVERGFSKHKAIHGKFRANLEESLVEKILFVRENKMFNTPDEKPTDEVDEMLDFDDCEL